MRAITAEEYNALCEEIERLRTLNANKKKPLEFSQKVIIATISVAIFVIVCTFVLAFLDKPFPEELVNDIITLTLTAEGGYYAQNGIRSIFTGDKTITNMTGT